MTAPAVHGLASRRYGAYGGPAPTGDVLTAYTGEPFEEGVSGYLLGTRPYAVALRRFIAPDPRSPFDEGGLNRWTYCGGDPLNRIDTTGHAWWDWIAGVMGRALDQVTHTFAAGMTSPVTNALAETMPRPVGPVSVVKKSGYTRNVYEFGERKSRIKHYVGEAAARKKIPARVEGVPRSAPRLRVRWHELNNAKGGINYAADTRVNATQVKDLMIDIGKRDDTLPIRILSGVHGEPSGLNWSKSVRVHRDRRIYFQDALNLTVMARLAKRNRADVDVVDIGGSTVADFLVRTEDAAHVVHAYCYGAADRGLMLHYDVDVVRVFDL